MQKRIKEHYKDAEAKTMKMKQRNVMLLSFAAAIIVSVFIFSLFVSITYAIEHNARMSITPSSGNAPLTVQANISADSQLLCTAFEIDWGDGSAKEVYEPASYDTDCYGGSFDRDFLHAYSTTTTATSSDLFTISAKAGAAPIAELSNMDVQVRVHGTAYEAATTTPAQVYDECFVSPNVGYTPLYTTAYVPLGGEKCDGTYEYYINWGDGYRSESRYCNNIANHYDTFDYQYATSSNYTANIVYTHASTTVQSKNCNVYITDAPTIAITQPSPNFVSNAVIGKSFTIDWEVQNIPDPQGSIAPSIRLLFITEDNQAGFIADLPITQTSYEWVPTEEPCLEGACQSAITEGNYYISASIIYDICNGDPYCGQQIPTAASHTTPTHITVAKTGTPVEHWLYTVRDRIFAYPVAATAPATVNFTTVLNSDASCAGGAYVIEYGDGESTSFAYPQGKCAAFASSFTHTYPTPNVYNVKLYRNGIESAQIPIYITEPTVAESRLLNLASVFSAFKNFILEKL